MRTLTASLVLLAMLMLQGCFVAGPRPYYRGGGGGGFGPPIAYEQPRPFYAPAPIFEPRRIYEPRPSFAARDYRFERGYRSDEHRADFGRRDAYRQPQGGHNSRPVARHTASLREARATGPSGG